VSRPRIGVLALQGDVAEHLVALRASGADPVTVRRADELEAVDGLVLPGGESTTVSKLLDVFGLMAPLRARVRDGLPVYGSCAGMILLADDVLDGRADRASVGGLDVVVRRNAFGRQVDSFEADLELDHLGELDRPFHALFIRAPWVEKVGPGVEVVGTVATGAAAGRIVAVRQAHLVATSFHPEVTGDPRVHAFFVDVVRSTPRP
jgi:5'-phosphate synthase pdxT subunit